MRLIVRFQPTTVEKTVESGQKQDRAFDSDDGAAKVLSYFSKFQKSDFNNKTSKNTIGTPR